MRAKRLRRLLWWVLATNLVTNAILLGVAGAVAVWWIRSARSGAEGGGSEGYELPEPAAEPARGPDLVRLRLSESEWSTLVSGEALRETGRGGGVVHVRARFLVRAEPDPIHRVLAEPAVLVEIYEDLEKAEVRESVDRDGERYDIVYFVGRSGIYDIEYTLRRDYAIGRSIKWRLVPGPGTSRLLEACQGAWFFTPTGIPGLTLVEYRNMVDVSGLPDFLLETLIDHNLPHVMRELRKRVE